MHGSDISVRSMRTLFTVHSLTSDEGVDVNLATLLEAYETAVCTMSGYCHNGFTATNFLFNLPALKI